jgi:hypothetical protein
MITTERMVRDLEATKKSFEGKFVGTGEVNVVWMIEEIVSFIKAQEADAELGRAVRLWFSKGGIIERSRVEIWNESELIEWAKGVE